jgi:hypothetical protein
MRLLFSQLPGRHERHLIRKQDNPLFPADRRRFTQAELTEAQRLDHEELEAYIHDLRRLVGEAVSLGPHEQSDVILVLKERLDKAYEQACRLADDQTSNKEAIMRLVAVIMQAVWKGAGNDTLAQQELQQEEEARRLHYELLEYPLVADLLDPDSPIKQEELLPTLLSADRGAFEAAVTLFDPTQLAALSEDGERFMQSLEDDKSLVEAKARLAELRAIVDAVGSA